MAKSPTDLSTQTLINRVMSGAKQYRSDDYLKAFGSISSSDLHTDGSGDYSRLEMIKLWNSLQNTPNKVRYYTFSLVRDNPVVQRNIKTKYAQSKWAYICHDKDASSEHKHYHYVLIFDSPRSFCSVADDLEIPVTMLQKVYSKKGILDYLTHENDPNKHHYDLSEVQSNFDLDEEKKRSDGFSFKNFYGDYCSLREGILAVSDFIDKYNAYFATLHISASLQACERLYNASCSGVSLSTRSEFCVPNPCHKNSIQTAFPSTRPEQTPWTVDGSMPFVVGSEVPPSSGRKTRKSYRRPNPRSDLV